MKTCPRCKIEKELTEFGKNKMGYLGVQTYCKACMNKDAEKYRLTSNGYNALNERYGKPLTEWELRQIKESKEWNKRYYTNFKTVI